MKKYVKVILKILLGIILLIILLISMILFLMDQHRKKKKRELLEKKEICHKNIYIEQQPKVDLYGFKNSELEELKFQIIRNNKLIKDTLILGIKNEAHTISALIPYTNFLKTDTILLITKSKLEYRISNFEYTAKQYHGMTGAVGDAFCVLNHLFTVNKEKNTNKVYKSKGILSVKK